MHYDLNPEILLVYFKPNFAEGDFHIEWMKNDGDLQGRVGEV